VKYGGTVLALGGLGLAALFLRTYQDPEAVRPAVAWTARLTLVLFVVAFVSLGLRKMNAATRISCRAAAFAMALHLFTILRLAQFTHEAPVAFASATAALLSLGGAAAAALVVAGWAFWTWPWYRWAVYWPWAVFLATYVLLPQQGQSSARIFAAPLTFLPVVVLLLGALAWRVHLDWKAARYYKGGDRIGALPLGTQEIEGQK
jgi:hypothetical protein